MEVLHSEIEVKQDDLSNNNDSMANKTYKVTDRGTELTKITVNGTANSDSKATTTCTPEVCRSARQRFQPPDLASDSPWNRKKTYFFVATVIVFVIWIVIYSIVSELELV